MAGPPDASAAPWTRRTTLVFLALAVLLLASLPWLVRPWYEASSDTNDGSIYVVCARAMLAGKGYSYLGEPFVIRPPGFSALLVPVLAWRGFDVTALHLLVSLFGVAGALFLFVHARARLGDPLAFALALALWLNPSFQAFCNRVMSDVPGAALLLGCLLVGRWADRAPSWRRELVLGIAIGLSSYIRSIDLFVAPAVVCARAAQRWTRGERGAWLAFARERALVVLVAPALVLLPWSIRDARAASPKAVDQTFVHSYSTLMWHREPYDPGSPLLSPGEILARVPSNLGDLVASLGARMGKAEPSAANMLAGSLVLLAALVALWRRRSSDGFLLFGTLAMLSVYITVRERFALPVGVLAYPAALDTLVWIGARFAGPALARAAALALVVCVAAIDFHPRAEWDEIRELDLNYRRTSAALAKALRPDELLAAPIGWHYAVYLERDVISVLPVVKRTDHVAAMQGVIEGYHCAALVAADFVPSDAVLMPFLLRQFPPPERVGEASLFRVPW